MLSLFCGQMTKHINKVGKEDQFKIKQKTHAFFAVFLRIAKYRRHSGLELTGSFVKKKKKKKKTTKRHMAHMHFSAKNLAIKQLHYVGRAATLHSPLF